MSEIEKKISAVTANPNVEPPVVRKKRPATDESGAVRRVRRPEDGTARRTADGTVRRSADGTVRRPADGETRVRRSADGTVRRPADGEARVRRSADGTVRRPASGETRVRRSADGTVRRPADGETRTRRSADGTVRRVPSNGANKVRRPAEGEERKRRSAAETALRERRVDEEVDRRTSNRTRYSLENRRGLQPNNNRRPKAPQPPKKKLPIYWIGLGVWAVILIIFGIIMLSYTNKSLVRYEQSQPENYMESAFPGIKQMVLDGSIVDKISVSSSVSELESPDIFKNIYLDQLKGKSQITYEKDSKSYDAKAPLYDILADGKIVAKIKLKSSNERRVFAILELCDWNIDTIQPTFIDNNITTYSYSINVPTDYKVTVNGVQLTEKYLTGKSSTNPDFANVLEYVTMPTTIEYKISGLINDPDIKIYDTTGAEVTYTPDSKGNIFVAYSAASTTEMPAELREYALECVQVWQDFLNHEYGNEDRNGVARVLKFLIEGNIYYDQALKWGSGIDITFMSNHTIQNPKYGDIIVDNYIAYNEDCFSVHLNFTKYMTLTRDGSTVTDTIDTVFYFVRVDDGKGGKRWAIADMISVINK